MNKLSPLNQRRLNNFISNKKIFAQLIDLEDTELEDFNSIEGKIIILEKADPGYDWIFSKNIGGLITKFGGAASHMAIRCAELGIPAVIGCGETLFNKYHNSNMLSIDSANKHVKIIK